MALDILDIFGHIEQFQLISNVINEKRPRLFELGLFLICFSKTCYLVSLVTCHSYFPLNQKLFFHCFNLANDISLALTLCTIISLWFFLLSFLDSCSNLRTHRCSNVTELSTHKLLHHYDLVIMTSILFSKIYMWYFDVCFSSLLSFGVLYCTIERCIFILIMAQLHLFNCFS